MELTTVHTLNKKFVMICCPFCKIEKRVATDKFKDIKHRITVRCKCGTRFSVQFNFRENYRKSVAFAGEFMMLLPRMPRERVMTVNDLSKNGLCFKTIDTVVFNKGDQLLVKFNLDDAKMSLIHKKVVVRSANDDFIRCEFTELSRYEKDLGFYLLA